ncbi:MAG: ABC transporter ATP-binding protein, partial [Candidatus Riflebacteria bacterium]
FMEGSVEEISRSSNLELCIWQGSKVPSTFSDLTRDGNIKGLRLFGDSIRFCYTSQPELEAIEKRISEMASDSLTRIKNVSPGLEDIFVNYLEKSNLSSRGNDCFSPLSKSSDGVLSVKIENLHKVFGDFTAVSSLNLEVRHGEIFGFLGPNGAGKSTTIRMLCGLLRPTSGRGSVAGFDLFKDAEEIKKNIGYMSQKFSLYSELTVLENITFYGGIYGLSGKKLKDRAEWALQLSGLSEKRELQIAILSLGFKQRLALACALLHDPPIVFLDEPTSGVDPLTRRQFWNTIEKLSRNGRTVFVTTHYMEESEYCDRIAFINSGKLMECGSPATLKNDFTGYQIIHIDLPAAADRLKELLVIEGIKDAYTYGHGYRLLLDKNLKPESVLSSLDRYFFNDSYKLLKPSMEDVFVHLSSSHFSEYSSVEFKT